MASRIYLPSSGAAPVTPSTWNFPNQINPLTFAGVLTKGTSAMTTKLEATGTTSPTFRAMLRYVIGPLDSQSISGDVHLQMRGMESLGTANANHAIAVKIIKPDGTDRAVLLAYTGADSNVSPYEYLTSLTNRRAYNASEVQPIPLTTQSATAGDYLVIELGFRSATTTTRNISLRYGDNSANDMENDTTSTNDYAPWVEFSGNLVWSNRSGSAAISGNGTLAGSVQKGGKGSALASGGGILAALVVVGMLGTGAISGGGLQTATGQKVGLASAIISGGGTLAATGEAQEGEQHSGAGIISGGGTIVSEGKKSAGNQGAVSGGGILASIGMKSGQAAGVVSGGGTVSSEGVKGGQVSAVVSGGGLLAGLGLKAGMASPVLTGSGSLVGIGEKQSFGSSSISAGGHIIAAGEQYIEPQLSHAHFIRVKPRDRIIHVNPRLRRIPIKPRERSVIP